MNKGLLVLLLFTSLLSLAQTPERLDRAINNPSYSSVYPAVSGDGRVMVYMTNYSDDGSFIMSMTNYRGGKWQRPTDVSIVGSSKVNNWGGYSLNYDGTELYFSSRRSNGVGLYDVWYSKQEGGEWSIPKNIGKPINSSGHEGNPSISPDGQRIYFMRCNSMSNDNVDGCKLFFSNLGPRGWEEPVEMPDHINMGNTTSPRILPDNRTLVFASDRPGGQGGVDLWMTRRSGSHWSDPVNIKPVNTAENDYFLTVSLRSIAFLTMEGERGNQAVGEIRLPPEYRLSNVIVTQGTIRDEEGNSLNAEIRAYNKVTEEYEYRRRLTTADDNFIMILPEGAVYDVAYNELRLNKMFQSEIVDATDLVAPKREYPNIVLRDLEAGMTIGLNGVDFEPSGVELIAGSSLELNRLAKVLERHPDFNIEVGVYQKVYKEDVDLSDEDLTEVRFDTTVVYEEPIRIDTLNNNSLDELIRKINEELQATIEDTAKANVYMARMSSLVPVRVEKVTSMYHNDRTEKQAAKVSDALVAEGLAVERITTRGFRDASSPIQFPTNQDRLVVVKLVSAN
jgi:OOP family OmpA-OmpF porin